MAKSNHIILKGKIDGEYRKFAFTKEEFDEFLLRFEENEVIDMSHIDISEMTLTKIEL